MKMSEEEMELYNDYFNACMEIRNLKQEESDETLKLRNFSLHTCCKIE